MEIRRSYLHNGISYTGKMTSLYWISPLILSSDCKPEVADCHQIVHPGDTGAERTTLHFNTLRQRQNGRHFADGIFKCIFLNENVSISIEISLNFVLKCSINNIPALALIMTWRRPGDKPLSEPTMVKMLTHICVTRPQWVKSQLGRCPVCVISI